MFRLIFILILFIISSNLFSQSYKKVKIFLNDFSDIKILAKEGFAADDILFNKIDNSAEIFVDENEFSKLKNLGMNFEILIDDWLKYYTERLSERKNFAVDKNQLAIKNGIAKFNLGSMGGFYTLEEVYNKLDSMNLEYPNLITKKDSIGKTVEGRPIYFVKISDNPNSDEDEPEVLYNALIHAREPQAMMTLIYFMYYLLENYETDASVKYLVDNRELYFIPVINVDGYLHNAEIAPQGGGLWRKNRKLNPDNSFGVDLNRNFGPQEYWNAPNDGSSTVPQDITYRGTAPFSEPETQTIKNFLAERNFVNCLNYHTYSNLLIYPYGAKESETPDSLTFREFARDMTKYNNYTYGTDLQTVGYATRGNSDDFMYDGDTLSHGKIFAMTPEVGSLADAQESGFWPFPERIIPLAKDNLFPNIYYAWIAGGYPSISKIAHSPEYFNYGDSVSISLVVKNKGLSDAENISLEIIPIENASTYQSEIFSIQNLKARTESDSKINVKLKVDLQSKTKSYLKLKAVTKINEIIVSTDTISLQIGIPVFAFKDSSDKIDDHWISQGQNGNWNLSTSEFFSAPNSYSESPAGNYLPNAKAELILKDSIDLSKISDAILTFRTKYLIEKDWDYGQVKISTDGENWEALKGKFSSYNNNYISGKPVYDGNQNEWVQEEIDLSAYYGKSVKIKFEFFSDEYIEFDGWYIDDIAIAYFDTSGVVSVKNPELNEFKFSLNQNYPNPFNPNTAISYQLSAQSKVELKIFDVLGREVQTLVNEIQSAGNYKVNFNAANLPSGIYIYKIKADNFIQSKKMILMK